MAKAPAEHVVEVAEPAVVDETPALVSPYASIASETDPTPTEAFAIALAGTPQKTRRRWPAWVSVLCLIVAVYAAAAVLLRNTLPDGTTIGGVPAGATVAEATTTVEHIADLAARAPVTLTAGDNTTSLDPASAGLSIDVDATVAGAGGFTLDPNVLWHRLRGEGTNHELVVVASEPAFTNAVNSAATELASHTADASVAIQGTAAVVTDGSQGVAVDATAARDDILAHWPTTLPIALTAQVTDPAITTGEAKALAASLNSHVFAGPTTLTGDNGPVLLPASEVAGASSVVATNGALAWTVDGASLSARILEAYPSVENKPTSATYHFDAHHKLKVTEGEPGRTLDTDKVDEAVVAAGGTTARTAPIPYILTDPKVTSDDLPTQDFTARVSHFRTPLTPEPIRTKNLVRAAQLVTGTVVKAGQKFDLTKTIGPVTAANGYYVAHIIVDGVFTTGIGGGLSQMATTSYNAGYFAGYHDVTHRPHSVWFPRYPAGRESTIYVGQINVVFENTTPYAMIMNAYVEGGYLNVDIWSTPYYTVKTWASPKTHVKQPTIVTSTASDCMSKSKGEPGFTITNTRTVYLGDAIAEKRSWTWTYKPDNGVRCVG